MAALADDELRERLCSLPGVGAKVANCVMLFAYERLRAFPIDVWIERVLREQYFPRARKVTAQKLREFCDSYFGEHGGYAQQYLFHHARKTTPRRRREARQPQGGGRFVRVSACDTCAGRECVKSPGLLAHVGLQLGCGTQHCFATFARQRRSPDMRMKDQSENANAYGWRSSARSSCTCSSRSRSPHLSVARPPLPADEDAPVELTMMDLSATPPPTPHRIPPTSRPIRTKETKEEPKEKIFESNANSIAASNLAGDR